MLLDIGTDSLYQIHMCLTGRCLIWLAATAGTKSRLLSLLWQGKEHHLLAPGSPRRTGGMAIDSGRTYCIDKHTVHLDIFLLHCLPVSFFLHKPMLLYISALPQMVLSISLLQAV